MAAKSVLSHNTMARRAAFGGVLASMVLVNVSASASGAFPAGIADPEVAIRDPLYSDPVFWWRYTSVPKDVYEPDPYFYWPEARVEGAPGPFVPAAAPGRLTIASAALEDAARWAESRKTYALIVVHRGKVQLERYWSARGQPDELTNGRALTRTVTHMMLGFALADGKLSLDDPISRYITEWRGDPRGAITVRQLAQNVSGLEVAPSLPATQVVGNKDLCLVWCGDVVRAALAYPLAHAPGTRFDFAQENFQLIGILAERALGKPFATALSERIWKRIGARDAALQLDRPGGTARVMCCMRATPRDWARLGMLVLDDGRWGREQVLPKGWVETMATPSERNASYGLGLWVGGPDFQSRVHFTGQAPVIPQSEPFVAGDVRLMEGGGFRVVYAIPSRDLMILRLGEQVPDWDHAYLPNALVRALDRR